MIVNYILSGFWEGNLSNFLKSSLCSLSLLEQILRTFSESGTTMKTDYLRCLQPRHRKTEAEKPCDRNPKSDQARGSGKGQRRESGRASVTEDEQEFAGLGWWEARPFQVSDGPQAPAQKAQVLCGCGREMHGYRRRRMRLEARQSWLMGSLVGHAKEVRGSPLATLTRSNRSIFPPASVTITCSRFMASESWSAFTLQATSS